jgi:hypothetical protein
MSDTCFTNNLKSKICYIYLPIILSHSTSDTNGLQEQQHKHKSILGSNPPAELDGKRKRTIIIFSISVKVLRKEVPTWGMESALLEGALEGFSSSITT